jgi:hypothetical protein
MSLVFLSSPVSLDNPVFTSPPPQQRIYIGPFSGLSRGWESYLKKIDTSFFSFLSFLCSEDVNVKIKAPVLSEPSPFFRFRYGRTACTWRRCTCTGLPSDSGFSSKRRAPMTPSVGHLYTVHTSPRGWGLSDWIVVAGLFSKSYRLN